MAKDQPARLSPSRSSMKASIRRPLARNAPRPRHLEALESGLIAREGHRLYPRLVPSRPRLHASVTNFLDNARAHRANTRHHDRNCLACLGVRSVRMRMRARCADAMRNRDVEGLCILVASLAQLETILEVQADDIPNYGIQKSQHKAAQ